MKFYTETENSTKRHRLIFDFVQWSLKIFLLPRIEKKNKWKMRLELSMLFNPLTIPQQSRSEFCDDFID